MENSGTITDSFEFKNHTRDFVATLDSLIIENATVSFEEFAKNLNDFIPCRNDYLKKLRKAIEHQNFDVARIINNDLFEESISRAIGVERRNAEGVNFIIYEIFLYTISILLKEEQFDILSELLKREFSKPCTYCSNDRRHIKTFKKIFYFRESSYEHGIKYIYKNMEYMRKDIDILELVDADILIFLKTLLEEAESHGYKNESLWEAYWQPFTRIYIKFGSNSPLFERCTSKSFFKSLKIIFGCSLEDNLSAFKSIIDLKQICNKFNCSLPIYHPKLSDYINISYLGTEE